MKPFNYVIALILLLAVAPIAEAQIKIPDTKVSFSFPNGGWKYLETNNVNKAINVYLYSYSKQFVVDSRGDTVIPFMRIYVRKNYSGTVYDLAYSRFLTQPFQSLDELTYPNGAFGYLGAYTNEDDGKDYEFRMLYIKNGTTAVEIRLETTLDTYNNFESDFLDIINSIKISK